MPTRSATATEVEADACLAGEPLHVQHARQDEQHDPVLRLQLHGRAADDERSMPSSVSALVGVTSALRICPPSRPISIRTKSSATRNHLRENAVDGIGMDERDLEPEEPRGASPVDQVRALGVEPFERRVKVFGLERDVMHPGPRRARNRPTGVSSPVGVTSSMRLSPTRTDTASTPCSTSGSRYSRRAPNVSYVAIASSRSVTATPR